MENAGNRPGELNTAQLIPFDSTRITECECVNMVRGRETDRRKTEEQQAVVAKVNACASLGMCEHACVNVMVHRPFLFSLAVLISMVTRDKISN